MTREKLIEKVARAIAESCFDWDAARSQEERDIFIHDARVAIDVVIEACRDTVSDVANHSGNPSHQWRDIGWRAALDAADAQMKDLTKGKDND